MPVALDLMQHVDDSTTKPALHQSRVEKMMFVRYSSPPRTLEDRGHYEMWLESISYLCDDMHWLLQQPHDKFWCQVVFDDNLHRALDSFLRYCPRSQDDLSALPDSGRQKQLELCRLIFMTFLRMSTHKESKDCFITPSVFGEILYENFLFDIPKILDICSLFGNSNGPLLTKMVSNIFVQQPKYTDDLKQTIPTIVQVFTNIASQCGVKLDSHSASPQKLDNNKNFNKNGSKMSKDDVQDLVMYLFDTATTLHKFLEVYPDSCRVFSEAQFCSVVANFYEGVVPILTDNIKQMDNPGPVESRKRNLIRLHHTKKSLLKIFHLIVNHICLLPVIENGTNDALVTSCIEEFLHIMTSVLNERRFLAAYEGMFVFQDDVDLLTQASSRVDVSQFDYIQAAINSAFATFGRRKSPHGDTNTGGRTSPDGAADSGLAASACPAPTQSKKSDPSTDASSSSAKIRNRVKDELKNASAEISSQPQSSEALYGRGAAAPSHEPSDVELESLICAVKDILPHLGDGFIIAALEELGWDQEKVISCVLEDSLPAALSGLSLEAPRQKRAINQGDGQTTDNPAATSLLDSRKNVFDYDEFDVFHTDKIKTENIHQGKKKLVLKPGDKGVSDIVRDRYTNYGSWEKNDEDGEDGGATVTVGEDDEGSLMYNDEYDDTYDTMNVGADDADSADELLANKTMPRVLADLERKNAKLEGKSTSYSDDDFDDSDEDESNAQKREDFVQDPAKLREQAAQRRISQAMRGRRGGGPPRNFDVKGGPKGQGQSKEVLHNRRVKDKFKGKSHRAGADKKMSKGMF